MTSYTPFASLLLTDCLATDPFGTLHRAIDRSGHSAGHDVLVRRYHPQWLDAGLLRNPANIRRNLIHLGHLKLFQGARLDLEEEPHFIWPLCQGRSLATVLEAARAQRIPFGLEPSLFLAWILCQHMAQLHRAGLPLGFLTPHRVWVGFDGLVELLDTPVITHLEALLPRYSDVQKLMRPYLQGPLQEGISRDAFQMGALLFEMLSHCPLPEHRYISHELASLRVDGAEGPEPLPSSIRTLLSRLLGLGRPFQNLEELAQELEKALFGQDDIGLNPSTFGLALSMHTLFRFQIAAENQALEEEQSGFGGLAAFHFIRKGAPPSATSGPAKGIRRRIFLPAAALLLGITGLAAWSIHARQPMPSSAPSPPMTMPPAPRPGKEQAHLPATIQPASPKKPTSPETPHPIAEKPKLPPAPASMEALVKLRVFVDEQGRVRQTHILEGAPPGSYQESAALAAALQLHLTPALEGGNPIRQWREITVRVR